MFTLTNIKIPLMVIKVFLEKLLFSMETPSLLILVTIGLIAVENEWGLLPAKAILICSVQLQITFGRQYITWHVRHSYNQKKKKEKRKRNKCFL